ncbi:MAG: T9SS type A sorting domain-containing protein [Owenweeksia sp.]
MKKVATALALAMGFSMLGQNVPDQKNSLDNRLKPAIAKPYLDEDFPGASRHINPVPKGKTSAAVVWSEDFASGFAASPNGAWIAGGSNANLVMSDNDGPDSLIALGWGPLPSPTAGNGFAIFDFYNRIPDVSGFATSPAQGLLTSPTINLNKSDVFISFYQMIFWCCNLDQEIFLEVSTDGGATWPAANRFKTNVTDRNDRHWDLGFGYYFEFDLSAILSSGGSNNVKLRFNWTSTTADANGQFANHYFWMIDDIQISDLPRHKMKFTESGGAPPHDIIFDGDGASTKTGIFTADEATPISFDSNIYNFGADDQTGVDLKVEIYDATGTSVGTVQSNNSSTLLKGDTLDFNSLTTNTWTPPANGTYTFVYSAISDSVPASPDSESVRDTFMLRQTDSLTSMDFGVFGNSIGSEELGNDGGAIAARYHFSKPAEIMAMIIDYSTATVAGGDIQIEIYDSTGFTFTGGFGSSALISRAFTLGTAEDNGALVRYDLSNNGFPLVLPPGTYYFTVFMFSNGGNNRVAIANDKSFPAQGTSSIMFDVSQGRWFSGYVESSTFNAPFLRVEKIPGVGLDEQVRADYLTIYPNPNKGRTSIELDRGGTFKLDLVNTTGQIINSRTVSTNGNEQIELDYSSVASGTYILKVSGDNYSRTARLVIQ